MRISLLPPTIFRIASAFSLSAVLSAGLLQAQSDNLAPNPSFSSWSGTCSGNWDGTLCPDGYKGHQAPSSWELKGTVLEGDSVVSIQGDYVSTGSTNRVSMYFDNSVAVEPGQVYRFSIAVKTDSLLAELLLRAQPENGSGNVGPEFLVAGPTGTTSWQRVAMQIEIPDGANWLKLRVNVRTTLGDCGGSNCGTAYLDDVSLTLEDNLAPNPSFSIWSGTCSGNWDGTLCPDGYEGHQAPSSWELQSTILEGDSVVSIQGDYVATGSTNRVSMYFDDNVVVEPGQVYRFSVAVKTDSLLAELLLRAQPENGSGNVGPEFLVAGPTGTTSWQRVGIQIEIPDGANWLELRVNVRTTLGDCGGGDCGTAYFDDVSLVKLLDHPFSNVCPNGQFLDLGNTAAGCRDLDLNVLALDSAVKDSLESLHIDLAKVIPPTGTDTDAGFKFDQFESAFADYRADFYDLDPGSCDDAGLRTLIDSVGGGGTVRLPACDIVLGKYLRLPSNTIIQGSGIGRTRIVTADTFTTTNNHTTDLGAVLSVTEVENVIVRDLTVDHGSDPTGIRSFKIETSNNVLIERVEAARGASAYWVHHTQNYTFRYGSAHRNQEIGGTNAKWLAMSECDQGVQPDFAVNGSFDDTDPPGSGWDGNSADLYTSDQQPDDYWIGVVELDSNNVLKVIATDSAASNRWELGVPHSADVVEPYEYYTFNIKVMTVDSLLSNLSLEAVSGSKSVSKDIVEISDSDWTEASIAIQIPIDGDSLDLKVVVEGDSAHCGGESCGTVYLDDVEVIRGVSSTWCEERSSIDWNDTSVPGSYWSSGFAIYSNNILDAPPGSFNATLVKSPGI